MSRIALAANPSNEPPATDEQEVTQSSPEPVVDGATDEPTDGLISDTADEAVESIGVIEKVSASKDNAAQNQKTGYKVVVAEPFLNLHTGSGDGFPVFHIVEQGQPLWITTRKYNWFKVVTKKDIVGWVALKDIQKTTLPDGSPVEFKEYTELDFQQRHFELGFRSGDFEGANLLAISGAWQFTENLAVELVIGQGLGDFSEVRQYTINVTNTPFPEWYVSPYFGVGGGVATVNTNTALVSETDRSDEVVFATLGMKTYITEKFLFRLEYRNYVILTTNETNEDIEEWTAGFSVFF